MEPSKPYLKVNFEVQISETKIETFEVEIPIECEEDVADLNKSEDWETAQETALSYIHDWLQKNQTWNWRVNFKDGTLAD